MVTTPEVKALAEFAGKRESKEELNGVLFDGSHNQVVATDTKIMIAITTDIIGEGSSILPREIAEALGKGRARSFELETNAGYAIATDIKSFKSYAGRINGNYPAYEKIFAKNLEVLTLSKSEKLWVELLKTFEGIRPEWEKVFKALIKAFPDFVWELGKECESDNPIIFVYTQGATDKVRIAMMSIDWAD